MTHLHVSRRALCHSAAFTASPSSQLSLSSLHAWLSLSRSSSLAACRHLPPSATHIQPRRCFAAPAKKADKKGAKKEEGIADPNRPIDVSFIHSWKADPIPKLRADAEYPEWVFDPSLYNPPSLAELRVRRDGGEALSEELLKRMDKLERRRHIKQRNDESRKA